MLIIPHTLPCEYVVDTTIQVFERYEFKVGDTSASIYLQPWFCNEKPGFLSPLRLIKHNRYIERSILVLSQLGHHVAQ